MLRSLRSKPVAIALIGLMTITTAALAAIKSAPKPTTDSVTIHSEMAKGEVTLSHQEDGTIATIGMVHAYDTDMKSQRARRTEKAKGEPSTLEKMQ